MKAVGIDQPLQPIAPEQLERLPGQRAHRADGEPPRIALQLAAKLLLAAEQGAVVAELELLLQPLEMGGGSRRNDHPVEAHRDGLAAGLGFGAVFSGGRLAQGDGLHVLQGDLILSLLDHEGDVAGEGIDPERFHRFQLHPLQVVAGHTAQQGLQGAQRNPAELELFLLEIAGQNGHSVPHHTVKIQAPVLAELKIPDQPYRQIEDDHLLDLAVTHVHIFRLAVTELGLELAQGVQVERDGLLPLGQLEPDLTEEGGIEGRRLTGLRGDLVKFLAIGDLDGAPGIRIV